jgi:hypothetical protein
MSPRANTSFSAWSIRWSSARRAAPICGSALTAAAVSSRTLVSPHRFAYWHRAGTQQRRQPANCYRDAWRKPAGHDRMPQPAMDEFTHRLTGPATQRGQAQRRQLHGRRSGLRNGLGRGR